MSDYSSDPATWPPELDALIAAPDHHTLLMENEHVRVLATRIPRGETVPVHTHASPAVLLVYSWSDFVRRDELGNVTADSRESNGPPPEVLWVGPLGPHTLENVGDGDIEITSIEVKQGA